MRKSDAKPLQQKASSAVPQPDPKKFGCRVRRAGEEEEVFVLAYHHQSVCCRAPPNGGVVHRLQAQFSNVMGNVALAFEESGQNGWQLVINYEFHAPVSTTWSAWCAAYSMAARMSSFSRSG